jgi:hypothetical protein
MEGHPEELSSAKTKLLRDNTKKKSVKRLRTWSFLILLSSYVSIKIATRSSLLTYPSTLIVTSNDGQRDSSESRNRGMDRGSNRDSSMDNRGTDSNMVQEGAAPGEEVELQHIDFGYPQ